MKRPHVTYFNTGPLPYYFGFTMKEKEFHKEFKRLGLKKRPWLNPGAAATIHHLEHPRYGHCSIMCLGPTKGRSQDEVWGLLTHEVVHAYQECVHAMRDKAPSDEFMAYVIQDWSQKVWLEYERQRKMGKRS